MAETQKRKYDKIIQAHAYDWVVHDTDKYGGSDNTLIHIWALNQQSKRYLLRIDDFPIFCFIELPSYINNYKHNWNDDQATVFIKNLSFLLKADAPIAHKFYRLKLTYYYQGDRRYPMIRVVFNNINAMRHCKNVLAKSIQTKQWGTIKCDVWEADISPIRKLLTMAKVKYSGWFQVLGEKVHEDEKISSIENEYFVNWKTMGPIAEDICQNWITYPGMLAFDIETYSNNHLAFPDKYNARHVAYMISCIFQRFGDNSTRKRYGIIMGNCNEIPKETLDDCVIIKVSSEYELIEAFAKVILETDPEVITGYNILSFDYPYLNKRLLREGNDWPYMGLILDEVPFPHEFSWSSDGAGFNEVFDLKIEGRINIDMLPVVRRDYKLDNYDLNTVSKHFLKKGKHDVKASDMFVYYENQQREPENEQYLADMTRVMAYCIQDSELVVDLIERTSIWIALVETSNIMGVTITDLFTRGQQHRCYSQLYDIAANSGYILNSRTAPSYGYSGGLVQEPIPGLYENVICLDFASLYPSIIQAYNIDYTTLVHPDDEDNVPDEDCHIIEFEQEEDAKAKFEDFDDNPLKDPELDKEILKEADGRKKRTTKSKDIVKVKYRFKFYKKKLGLLPRLESDMVAARRAVQAKMKGVSDPILKMILDKRQLAIKVSCNSFYGFLGVRNNGKMPLIEGAMSITAIGRELINKVNDFLEVNYQGKIIYNDTDCLLGTSPLLIRRLFKKNKDIDQFDDYYFIDYVQFSDLFNILEKEGHKKTEMYIKDRNITKEYIDVSEEPIEIWSDNGWTYINYIVRHKNTKEIYRVVTHSGIVECTEDHSLLKSDGEEVSPKDIDLNTVLLHSDLPVGENGNYLERNLYFPKIKKFTYEHGWALGFFFAEGTCGTYNVKCGKDKNGDVKYGERSTWSISNQNIDELIRCKKIFEELEPEYSFVIDPCMKSSAVDKLNVRSGGKKNIDIISKKYQNMFHADSRIMRVNEKSKSHTSFKYKKVPGFILNASEEVRRGFFNGYYAGDGSKDESTLRFDCRGMIGMAGLSYIAYSLGMQCGFNCRDDKPDVFRCNIAEKSPIPFDKTKKIIKISESNIRKSTKTNIYPEDEYVYDIETENHHFSAGIGRLVVHNSSMVALEQIKSPKECTYWGEFLAQEISGVRKGQPLPGADLVKNPEAVHTQDREGLFMHPLRMEYEKSMRMLCIRKKKYAALMIGKNGEYKTETNENGEKELYILKRGIVLARRDNSRHLRALYTSILRSIMNKEDMEKSLNFLVDGIKDLVSGRVDVRLLSIVKQLGSNYAVDTCCMKVFSDDLLKSGKPAQPGDRLNYLIVDIPGEKLLGHRMKLVEQYFESQETDTPYKIDYSYYIEKVLANPINQLFEVAFKDTIAQMSHVNFRPSKRHKPITLDKPVNIIAEMIKRGYDIEEFREGILMNLNHLKGENVFDPLIEVKITKEPLEKPLEPKKTSKTSNVVAPKLPDKFKNKK